MARLASRGSADVMDEGLTVNLDERSATEFFQKKVLLRDIHMAIPQGHMVLLLGGSGAGKTAAVPVCDRVCRPFHRHSGIDRQG